MLPLSLGTWKWEVIKAFLLCELSFIASSLILLHCFLAQRYSSLFLILTARVNIFCWGAGFHTSLAAFLWCIEQHSLFNSYQE